jgi:aryl-alcohol dehydrogenase-like predicted oxidoreductase
MEDLRREGKVRTIGVSNFGIGDLRDLLHAGRPSTNQLPYSLLGRAIEYEVLPLCGSEGVGVLCYSPLAQGLLAGRFASPADVPDGRARTRHFSAEREHARHGEPGCEAETFVAIDSVRSIANGLGLSMAAVSLAWLLHQPGVSAVIAGARTPQQVAQTAAAAEVTLRDDAISSLAAATDEVKHILGPNPDLWQSKSRYR